MSTETTLLEPCAPLSSRIGGFAADTLDLAALGRRLSAAATPRAATDAVLDALCDLGVDALAAGEIDLDERGLSTYFVLPEGAAERTVRMRCGEALAEAIERYPRPFTCADLRHDRCASTTPRMTLELEHEEGWLDMLFTPIARSGSRFGFVVLLTQRANFPESALGLLSVCSLALFERVRLLARRHGFASPPARLTERERQCLQLVADGLSDRRIAERLGIGEATARSYFEAARLKLRTRTRAHTVARAASLGIVFA